MTVLYMQHFDIERRDPAVTIDAGGELDYSAYTFIATLAINNYTEGYKHGQAFRYSTSWNDGVLAWGSTSACKITTTTGQWRVGFWAKRSETTNPNTGFHVMCGIGR